MTASPLRCLGVATALALATAPALLATAAPALASSTVAFSVTVTNVSKQTGTMVTTDKGPKPIPLSPGAYAVYTGKNPVFTVGGSAGPGLESLAEDGFPMKLASELKGAANVTDSGTFKQPAGPKPALLPGQSATFKVTASPGQKLSFATMFVPSNDAFYGAANGIDLFDASGAPASGDVTSQIAAYDAGTEQDQPFYGPATKPVQPSENFGPSETKPVQPVADAGGPNTYPATNKVIRVSINAMPAGGASTGAGGTAGDEHLGEIAAGAGLIVFAGGALALRRRKAIRG